MPAPSTTPKAAINLPHNHPVAHLTLSCTPADFITRLAMPVMYEETGQLINYCQLRTHPKFAHIWNQYYSNEMVRLCQGVGTGKDVTRKISDGTDTFHVIN